MDEVCAALIIVSLAAYDLGDVSKEQGKCTDYLRVKVTRILSGEPLSP